MHSVMLRSAQCIENDSVQHNMQCEAFTERQCSALREGDSADRHRPDLEGHTRDKILKRKIRKMFLIIF